VEKIFEANGLRYHHENERPSFKLFVNYILSHDNVADFDDHWRLQWLHCHVCEWDFDVPGNKVLMC
jgi:hypothetical protein